MQNFHRKLLQSIAHLYPPQQFGQEHSIVGDEREESLIVSTRYAYSNPMPRMVKSPERHQCPRMASLYRTPLIG